MHFKIVSDSSSNLFELPDVDYQAVPMKIITSEKEYTDEPALDLQEMTEELLQYKGKTTSSCPNYHEWSNAFEGADGVFAVTITGALSGAYSAAVLAAQDHPQAHVINSLSTGPEMLLIIERLRELILQGLSFEEIKAAIEAYQPHTHLLFSLESLNNLARNGRCNPAVAKIAGVLGIRVLGKASAEGTLEPLHKCRGDKKLIDTFLKELDALGYQGGKLRITHCMNESLARELKTAIAGRYPAADIQIGTCKGLCTFYAEKGGLIVGFEDLPA